MKPAEYGLSPERVSSRNLKTLRVVAALRPPDVRRIRVLAEEALPRSGLGPYPPSQPVLLHSGCFWHLTMV